MPKGRRVLIGMVIAMVFEGVSLTGVSAETIKIGSICPLSGGGAFYGEDQKRAIGLGLDQIGGKISVRGKEYKIEVVFY